MPPSWLYRKMDFTNLKDIHDRYGSVKLKTYPSFDFKKYVYYSSVLKLSPVSILNYIPYNKKEVKEVIIKELGWRDYGGKHYESMFTKFYQAYILPTKFKIDKRKPHLSNLICSGQLTREEALAELQQPLYQPRDLQADREYVVKKLGLTEAEFDAIMALPPRRHEEFKTDKQIKDRYMNILERTAPIRKALKKIVPK